ncbi:DUF6950 family protein [Leisingera caerulea]|uniref:DUF6950 family protein n=1 Tax=Leisingera caerulea TaxID=506591 RepID=UPI0004805930|nr:hypothetical protein [Leisingera caerulea]
MTPLYRELHRWMALPFIWGETDCMLVLADWIERVRGADPAAHIRGTYDSRGSCQRETGFLRDPVAAVEGCLATIGGLERVQEPRKGDIAVIVVPEADGRVSSCGAVWLGSAWGCKGQNGTTTLKPQAVLRVLAIWSVGYEA